MKHAKLFKVLCLISLLITCLLAGTALAEPELLKMEMELFTAGDFPEYISMQTFSEDSFDSYIYGHLKKGTEMINILDYQISLEDLSMAITMVVNDHPDLFYVDSEFGYLMSGDYVQIFAPQYLFTGDELTARQSAFDASVEKIAAHANQSSSTVGKLLLVNDYFCTNYSYDESLTIYRPDQLFSGGTGVCQAYMLGYAAVLDELGIPNTHATSVAMKHTWNVVNVGDDWYHVDVTWNDPVPDVALQASHAYFLLSDSGMLNSKHYDWTSSAAASSTTYDSCFWKGIYTPLAPVGDNIYYLSTTANNGIRSVMNWDASTGNSSEVFNYSIVGADNSYTYSASYGPIAADANYIYYGSRGFLWAADHSGNNATPVYSTGNDAVHIRSCGLKGNTLYMRIKEEDNTLSVVSCPVTQRLGAIFEPALVELQPGETASLTITSNIGTDSEATFAISSSDTSIVTIDKNNKLTAGSPGVAYIIAECAPYQAALCPIIVHSDSQIIVPSNTVELKSESFSGTAAQEVILPEGLQIIGANAFSACDDLILVHVPASVQSIDATAFPANEDLTLICTEYSKAAEFAQEQSIPYVLTPAETEE